MSLTHQSALCACLMLLTPICVQAQGGKKPDEVLIVNESNNPIPVDIIDKDTPIAVSGEVSVAEPVEEQGIVDAYVLNST